jgi:hypothetical protein
LSADARSGYLLIQAATPTAANPLAGATTHIQLLQDQTDFPTTGCQDTAGNPVACPVGAGCNGVTAHCWGGARRNLLHRLPTLLNCFILAALPCSLSEDMSYLLAGKACFFFIM